MGKSNSTIYDDVLRTIQERHPELLIPLFNEVFHTSYSVNARVSRLPEEYQKLVSKVVADSCNIVENYVYHVECQSTKDGKMMLRMVEYDFMIALTETEKKDGSYHLKMPRSCVLYLRGSDNVSSKEELKIEFADGQVVSYCVPNIKLEDYTLDEIFEKKLLIFLPYYIMRYEKKFREIAHSEERMREFLLEYQEMIEQLDAVEELKQEGLMQDMVRLIRRIADYQLRRERELRERMDEVMGGKVLELPSDKLREEREQGIEQGITQGIEALVETCKEFGVSREGTEERIKAKFKLTAGRAREYMQKYWK